MKEEPTSKVPTAVPVLAPGTALAAPVLIGMPPMVPGRNSPPRVADVESSAICHKEICITPEASEGFGANVEHDKAQQKEKGSFKVDITKMAFMGMLNIIPKDAGLTTSRTGGNSFSKGKITEDSITKRGTVVTEYSVSVNDNTHTTEMYTSSPKNNRIHTNRQENCKGKADVKFKDTVEDNRTKKELNGKNKSKTDKQVQILKVGGQFRASDNTSGRDKMANYLYSVNGEKFYKCPYCHKNMKQKGALNIHLRTHTGEKPYACTVCGKSFVSSGDLKKHMRIHSDERPYVCCICNKGFRQMAALHVHTKTHTNERDFQCPICKKRFIQQHHMKKHVLIHTGQRDFKCDLCGKQFYTKYNLVDHRMAMHNESKCSKSYDTGVNTKVKCGNKRQVKRKHIVNLNIIQEKLSSPRLEEVYCVTEGVSQNVTRDRVDLLKERETTHKKQKRVVLEVDGQSKCIKTNVKKQTFFSEEHTDSPQTLIREISPDKGIQPLQVEEAENLQSTVDVDQTKRKIGKRQKKSHTNYDSYEQQLFSRPHCVRKEEFGLSDQEIPCNMKTPSINASGRKSVIKFLKPRRVDYQIRDESSPQDNQIHSLDLYCDKDLSYEHSNTGENIAEKYIRNAENTLEAHTDSSVEGDAVENSQMKRTVENDAMKQDTDLIGDISLGERQPDATTRVVKQEENKCNKNQIAHDAKKTEICQQSKCNIKTWAGGGSVFDVRVKLEPLHNCQPLCQNMSALSKSKNQQKQDVKDGVYMLEKVTDQYMLPEKKIGKPCCKTVIIPRIQKKRFPCNLCSRILSSKYTLMHHMKLHSDDRIFQCADCLKAFVTSSDLIRHTVKHSGEKRYSCTSCSKQFSTMGNLKIHLKVHTGERMFGCHICQKSFKQKAHLNKHLDMHKDLRKFNCTHCEKRFRTKSNLESHMCIHMGLKPYACQYCGRCFSDSTGLQCHHRTHTGEKPYTCTVCGKSYPQSGTLAGHMVTHTGERPYSCDICDAKFKFRTSVNKHKKNCHNLRP